MRKKSIINQIYSKIIQIQLTGRETRKRRTENGGESQLITRPMIKLESADLTLCPIVYGSHFIDFLVELFALFA